MINWRISSSWVRVNQWIILTTYCVPQRLWLRLRLRVVTKTHHCEQCGCQRKAQTIPWWEWLSCCYQYAYPYTRTTFGVDASRKRNVYWEYIELLSNYDFSHQRRLSFEYIVFKDFNDSEEHAKAIVQLLKGLDCRMNLIRFHPIPNIPLQGVDDHRMEKFRNYLTQHGVFTTIRASRGQDIFAACGLLSTAKKIEEERGRGRK